MQKENEELKHQQEAAQKPEIDTGADYSNTNEDLTADNKRISCFLDISK